ncbi:THO complex subunit 4C [Zancudomyces culisetae]|uniref:THO complex subunit 4C n=1 Tax=Zancudomyces culisetae TaxID=1213189 RepID=A0A1R1PL90_ZANCU|nr:THO complex subunit 4C [Zancudomyces culisetae]|eukprot:OMH81699.1 THO complex subunit 4C [Zancudomyces culisetae]
MRPKRVIEAHDLRNVIERGRNRAGGASKNTKGGIEDRLGIKTGSIIDRVGLRTRPKGVGDRVVKSVGGRRSDNDILKSTLNRREREIIEHVTKKAVNKIIDSSATGSPHASSNRAHVKGEKSDHGNSRNKSRDKSKGEADGKGELKKKGVNISIRGESGPTAIFVGNLDPEASTEDVRTCFRQFGALVSCQLLYDSGGKSTGNAELVYKNKSEAIEAIKQLNNIVADGRTLIVQLKGDTGAVQNLEAGNNSNNKVAESINMDTGTNVGMGTDNIVAGGGGQGYDYEYDYGPTQSGDASDRHSSGRRGRANISSGTGVNRDREYRHGGRRNRDTSRRYNDTRGNVNGGYMDVDDSK